MKYIKYTHKEIERQFRPEIRSCIHEILLKLDRLIGNILGSLELVYYRTKQHPDWKHWDGSKIKEQAKKRGLSLLLISRDIGVSRQTLYKWTKGQTPKGQYIVSLCKYFGKNAEYFFCKE